MRCLIPVNAPFYQLLLVSDPVSSSVVRVGFWIMDTMFTYMEVKAGSHNFHCLSWVKTNGKKPHDG